MLERIMVPLDGSEAAEVVMPYTEEIAHFDPGVDVEGIEERLFNLMTNLEFLPNSPTLMNAGTALGQVKGAMESLIGSSLWRRFRRSICQRRLWLVLHHCELRTVREVETRKL